MRIKTVKDLLDEFKRLQIDPNTPIAIQDEFNRRLSVIDIMSYTDKEKPVILFPSVPAEHIED